ncbi:hypothetical protein DIPPA_09336 [Diplonema papillatum]|nr:hypothetical protein DIPPA_09336 [Diplonema papillatum]
MTPASHRHALAVLCVLLIAPATRGKESPGGHYCTDINIVVASESIDLWVDHDKSTFDFRGTGLATLPFCPGNQYIPTETSTGMLATLDMTNPSPCLIHEMRHLGTAALDNPPIDVCGCRVPSRGMERHRATLRSCGVASDARSRPAFAMKAFTTPKKDGRTARLVLDARPLNDAMRRPPSMDLPRLRDFIAEVERHRFAMQCDGVSYFYQFPVDASISRYFGIGMKGCDMLLNVLCMGWSWAPCIAQRASNVLVRDLGLAWVDNFLVLGGTLDEAERNVAVFRKRAQAARVEVRAEGDDALWQFAEVFGGAVWATDILAVPRCHFAALLSFAGRLGGRMVGAAAPVWDEVVDVPPSARRELGALRKIVRENPWVVGGVPEDTGSVLWTDASSRAWAALLEAEGRFVDGRQGVFAGPDADAHINLKEMLAFAEGVVRLCWAPGAQRCRIDNAAVVGAVAKGSSSSYAANRVLSRSLRVAGRRGIVLRPDWVPSGGQLADPYTRGTSLPRFPAQLPLPRSRATPFDLF